MNQYTTAKLLLYSEKSKPGHRGSLVLIAVGGCIVGCIEYAGRIPFVCGKVANGLADISSVGLYNRSGVSIALSDSVCGVAATRGDS